MKSLCLGKVDTSLPISEGAPGKRKKRLKEHTLSVVDRKQEADVRWRESECILKAHQKCALTDGLATPFRFKAEDTAWSENSLKKSDGLRQERG